ncbi:hypothetical protein [Sphingobacterium rhinopitheci]|uniref:hypothetical protein n=1 Tax=Sphingobacterium rhinopitheci TaxID=2781960 RepID=UPI001F51ACBB|nr:hypothetical protein [Sphingobacterium rhinopitheci]MCI0921235.1 hypothetical protein [Sphingobacterium rhinopitheci]
MKKIILGAFAVLFAISSHAQEYKWGFGFYGDIQASSNAKHTFGMQGKYDLDNHSALQAQVFGRTNYVGIGADYLYSFMNKKKSDFNVFLGVGVEENFYWDTEDDGILRPEPQASYFNGAGQVGLSYYFRPVRLSLYGAYKVKYDFNNDEVAPNFISLGVRYHLW